jgi:hypothetical protein
MEALTVELKLLRHSLSLTLAAKGVAGPGCPLYGGQICFYKNFY